MARPDVAVVIPTYGRPRATCRAIRSALAQKEVRAEIVVVDDASPEPFVPAADIPGTELTVLRLARNCGPAGARNAGVAASRAPFIAFLDSDDFFLPETLAPRLAALDANKEEGRPVLLAAGVWRWRPGRSAQLYVPTEADSVDALASGCWYFPGSTSLFARATWERVGPLDARLRRLEDLDWGIRLARAGGVLRVTPEPAAVIQRSPRAGLGKVTEAAVALLRRYSPGGELPLDARALSRLKAYLSLEKASSALGERKMASFVLNLGLSLARRPRLSLHQQRWWVVRDGSAEELDRVERIAKSFDPP
jgi:glycosyltransferase involved in cell wall biosynthesis